jgi:hypothetical protein
MANLCGILSKKQNTVEKGIMNNWEICFGFFYVMLMTWHRICAGFLSTALLVLCTFIRPYGRLPADVERPFNDVEEAEVCNGAGPLEEEE